MSRYELSLSPDYLAHWTVVDAVRELFQNARDQQEVDPSNVMFFDYDEITETLKIGNKLSILEVDTLLLGKSSKREKDNLVGKFGEGYKIASLVLLRQGKKMVFYNYGNKEVWVPKFVKSRRYKSTILVFDVDRKFIFQSTPDNNLTIEVSGITPEEFEDIQRKNLHCWDKDAIGDTIETRKGTILLNKEFAHKVFVGGLFVCEYEKYKYGYDFKPQFLSVDRDRKLVDNFQLRYLSSEMWTDCEPDRIVALVNEGVSDVEFVKSHLEWSAAKEKEQAVYNTAYKSFKDTYGEDAEPVTTNLELDETRVYTAANPVIVPETVKKLVQASKYYEPPKSVFKGSDPLDMLDKWFEKVKVHLNKYEYAEFKAIRDRLRQ